MTAVIIGVHVLACVLLIVIILIQRGRGGGLVESLSGVESMFGTNTNAFLSRLTTILSTIFFLTCLSLALLSAKQSKSLLSDTRIKQTQTKEQPATGVQDPAAKQDQPQPIEQVPPQAPQATGGAPTTQP